MNGDAGPGAPVLQASAIAARGAGDPRVRARAALEATRERFHALLAPLGEAELALPSATSRRTVGGVVAHLVQSTERSYPMLVARALAGRRLPAVVGTRLGHEFLYRWSQWRAARASGASLAADYDAAHGRLLARIETLEGDDWRRRIRLPRPRAEELTVEQVFTVQAPRHLAHHAEEIARTLRAARGR